MANSADLDQLAFSEANWSGFTLFAKEGLIRVQQDKDYIQKLKHLKPKKNKIYICIVVSYENFILHHSYKGQMQQTSNS